MSLVRDPDPDDLLRYAAGRLSYDPDTGDITWLVSVAQRIRPGMIAGSVDKINGYRRIWINGRLVHASRIAWLLYYGRWPRGDVDHINRNKTDNRLINLREATRTQNIANSRTRKKTGLKGATKTRCGKKWAGKFKGRWLGTFETEQEAHEAYLRIAMLHYGEFVRAA